MRASPSKNGRISDAAHLPSTPPWNRRLSVAVKILWLIGLLPGLLLAQSRTQIGAPIEQFRLPVFGEDGNRIWELRGDRGVYHEDGYLDVERMTLRTFPEGQPKEPELLIQSPKARIFPEENRAAGEGLLFLEATNGSYAIVGRQWQWRGKDNQINIGAEARVTFRQTIGDILE